MTQLQSSRIVSQINSLFNTLSFVICGIFLVWVDICLMGVRFALTLLRGFQVNHPPKNHMLDYIASSTSTPALVTQFPAFLIFRVCL